MALIDEYLDVARRWDAARDDVERTRIDGPNADSQARIAQYLKHQHNIAGGDSLWGSIAPPPLLKEFGQERIIGQSDLISFNFLQKAIAIGRFVGRVSRRGSGGGVRPVGTGSMVSPRLMLTNHHVLPERDDAAGHVIEFNYQLGEDETPLAVSTFALAQDEFYASAEALDYTLVAVKPASDEGTPLDLFGWSKLNGAEAKILKGHALNIIQHPEGAYKQIVLRRNRLMELKDEHFLYETDTMRGSSGAPVYSDQWEVVALHHRSVPKMLDGQVMSTKVMSGTQLPWHDGMPESEIEWVGNEGVRVSFLVKHIKALKLGGAQERLRSEMFAGVAPSPFLVSKRALGLPHHNNHGHSASPSRSLSLDAPAGGALDVSFPIHIRIRVGDLGMTVIDG